MIERDLKIVCGSACAPSLVEGISRRLMVMGEIDFQMTARIDNRFRDGEFLPQIGENVRGADVYIVQPTPRKV